MAEVRGAFKRLAVAETYRDKHGDLLVKDSFPICPSFGVVWYREVDLGFPDVRSSAQEFPDADGTLDSTQFTGARSLSLSGVVINDAFGPVPENDGWPTDVSWNSASWFCTLLSSWASPARRYRFYFDDEFGRSRFMDVRGDSFSATADGTGEAYREFQLGMVCPSGKVYSFSTGPGSTSDGRHAQRLSAFPQDEPGRSYDLTPPRTYPTDSLIGAQEVFYRGSVATGFVCEIYTGAASTLRGPRITVIGPTGQAQSIGLDPAFTIPEDTDVVFDTTARTVIMRERNASTSVSLEQYLAAPLQWPVLQPGRNPLLGDQGRKLGWNKFDYDQAVGAPAADLTITAKWYDADLH
jgi:hypothetical protein